MSPPSPPQEQIGEAHRSTPTPFLTKTYQLVDNPAIDDVISWSEDGSAFVVWDPTVFARDLLPNYFKHNNFSSFVRQLNTYGFRKLVPDRWEFTNESFRRGEKRLLCDIQRRKAPTASPPAATAAATAAVMVAAVERHVSPVESSGDEQVISNCPPLAIPTICNHRSGNNGGVGSSGSCSSRRGDLIEHNERLRRENSQMSKELSNMKTLCNNIFAVISNYANGLTTGGGYSETGVLRPLDLMLCGGETGPEEVEKAKAGGPTRLFGVQIGKKRWREGGSSAGAEQGDGMEVDIEVKSEPSDGIGGKDDGEGHRSLKPCRNHKC